MPHHDAPAPPQNPSTRPANVLRTLDGTRQQDVAGQQADHRDRHTCRATTRRLSQSVIRAEREGQLFVVDAQLVKDGCMQVADGLRDLAQRCS